MGFLGSRFQAMYLAPPPPTNHNASSTSTNIFPSHAPSLILNLTDASSRLTLNLTKLPPGRVRRLYSHLRCVAPSSRPMSLAAPAVAPPAMAPPPAGEQASPPRAAAAATASYSPFTRKLHQLGLFFAGAAFMAASVAVSRRSVIRRRLETVPAFHTSNRAPARFDGADRVGLAAAALGLATLNVASFGVLLTGGIAWGFDLCSVAELRERTQAALRRPGNYRDADPAAEKELEDMMKTLLERLGMDATPPERPAERAAEEPAKKPADGEASPKK